MIRLEDLLHSLTAVIIRYHDHHTPDKKMVKESNPSLTVLMTKAREHSRTVLNRTDEEVSGELNALIEKTARKHLLTYILNQLLFLKNIIDSKVSFTEAVVEGQKQRITQMLIAFKGLLSTPKSKKYPVNGIDLDGLLNNDLFNINKKFCYSGDLLNNLLDQLGLSCESTDEMIADLVDYLCTNHQNRLKAAEYDNKTAEYDNKTAEYEDEIRRKNTIISALEERNSQLILKNDEERKKTETLSSQLDSANSELQALRMNDVISAFESLDASDQPRKENGQKPSSQASSSTLFAVPKKNCKRSSYGPTLLQNGTGDTTLDDRVIDVSFLKKG